MGIAAKGPVNEPTLVTNWSQFAQAFGEFVEGRYLAQRRSTATSTTTAGCCTRSSRVAQRWGVPQTETAWIRPERPSHDHVPVAARQSSGARLAAGGDGGSAVGTETVREENYASTSNTRVSGSTSSYAIASAAASVCIQAMTASMSAMSMRTATHH